MSGREMALGSELAKETLLLLESAGWCKGNAVREKGNPTRLGVIPVPDARSGRCEFCLWGAIKQAGYEIGLGHQEKWAAEKALAQSLTGTHEILNVIAWNDNRDTTWEDVRERLLAAIDGLTEADEEQE